MRSIRYVLGGDPHNLDDCLDLLHREKPEEVSVELITNEMIAEMYILKQLIGRYSWKFTNRNVQYEEVYGGCFAHETEQRQGLSIDNANSRFNNSIRKIENMGIEVIGSDKSFKYSLIYQGGVKK